MQVLAMSVVVMPALPTHRADVAMVVMPAMPMHRAHVAIGRPR